MPSRDSEFGREKLCLVCNEWWPETGEFFFRDSQTQSHNLRSPCKACINERREAHNKVTPCCVPGCSEPRYHWRYSRCKAHQAELSRKSQAAYNARKAARG